MKDQVILKLIDKEFARQQEGLVMIPSENLASQDVLEILSTCLNNKYSEGYPGKRYYTGNEFVDEIENLAIDRAKQIFEMEHANVQPLSGANANYAAISAVLEPGDKILSMELTHGGHLTHGLSINFSGKLYEIIHYGVDKNTETIDYENLEHLAKTEKPKLIISGASSYPRKIDFQKISDIAHENGALHLADISHIAGLIATGVHQQANSADIVTFTTHKTLRGPRSAVIMCTKDLAKKIDRAVFPGLQGGPHENVIAAKAVNFLEVMQPEFKEYQIQIINNAKTLEGVFKEEGIRLVSGGTDNHLLLLDVSTLEITGHDAANALEKAKIYVNKNVIPFDQGTPMKPSGIRLGTPYLTARGMKEAQMRLIGKWISQIIKDIENTSIQDEIARKVLTLTKEYPLI